MRERGKDISAERKGEDREGKGGDGNGDEANS